jgi:hypothetical protein
MTNKEAIKWLESIDEKYIHGGDEWYDEQRHEAIKTAIKALEFAESQRLCCDNCVNHGRKSKEVCTSPYGQCAFFEDNQ